MRTYHLYLLLKTIYESGPAEDLLESGFTPGQLSRLIIEAINDGFLERKQRVLQLSERGTEKLKDLRLRSSLIKPDGRWISESKNIKFDSTRDVGIYIPNNKRKNSVEISGSN